MIGGSRCGVRAAKTFFRYYFRQLGFGLFYPSAYIFGSRKLFETHAKFEAIFRQVTVVDFSR